MNMLAVDDEYYALELMKHALEEVAVGSTVYLCRDVRSALDTAVKTKIDVAFLDIHMPEMNGVELARELKGINPKINIVFATGFSEYMKEGIDLRMSGYIMKPVTPEAVLWEDEEYDRTKQKNLQVYIASLVKTLQSVGIYDLILKNRQGILVNTKIVDCDYYRFLEGDTRAINSFTGQYMSAYSWAEFTVGYLENRLLKIK